MIHAVEQIGAFAGLAAFLGLAVLALLSFAHGRDIRRLREWAGSAPERDAERKEATSAIAAQRAEELRQLEEARTAEHEAVESRELRRQRREEGLPELTRGERFRESLSKLGETLSQPLVLGAIFLVCVLIAAGVVYAVTSGGGEGAKGNQGTTSTAKSLKPSEVEVAVLNGTSVAGLAATFGEKIEGKGFETGPVTNSSETYEKSVVMFKPGHEPEAKLVAKRISIPKLEPMSSEISEVAGKAKVAVVVGEDNAEAAE
ncbi:MAG: LytR C-terminal domain-containing protein [Actinobacteria bacterium]|nr:LytR C-terminal domain-containing protein [Actinomycetota bacterium]